MVGVKTVVGIILVFAVVLILAIKLPGAIIEASQNIINLTEEQTLQTGNENAEPMSAYYSKEYTSSVENAATIPPKQEVLPDDLGWVNDQSQAMSPSVKVWVGSAQETAKETGVPACQLMAHLQIESTGGVTAVGTSGEVGLLQLLPQVAFFDHHMKVYDPDKRIAGLTPGRNGDAFSTKTMEYLRNQYTPRLKALINENNKDVVKLSMYDDRFNTKKTFNAGAMLLKSHLNYLEKSLSRDLDYNSWEVIASYNGGLQPVINAKTFGNLPPELREYVSKVTGLMNGPSGFCTRPS